MVPDYLVVRDEGRVATAKVIETFESYGTVVAKVEVNPFDERFDETAFVEVPDDPETPEYVLECTDCGHVEEQPDGTNERVGDKYHRCNHESNAKLLGQIHEAKTGHDTSVQVTPA